MVVAKVRLSTTLVRYPLRIDKVLSMKADSATLVVEESVTNLGQQEVEFAWLQHIAFGPPLVGPGMSLDMRAGACTAGVYKQARMKPGVPFEWPNAPGLDGSTIDASGAPPDFRCEDNIYAQMKEPWYAVRNSAVGLTVGVSWDLEVLPYLWLWYNYGALDYPWWGRSRNIGLEPSSSITELGIREYLEKKNNLRLSEGESRDLGVRYSVEEGSASVRAVDRDGKIEH